MAGEGEYPKVAGDVAYSSEANGVYSSTQERLMAAIGLSYVMSGAGYASLFESHYKNTYFDSIINGSKLDTTSTASFTSAGIGTNYYSMSAYPGGSPVNAGFEDALVSGTNWWSGLSGGMDLAGRNTAWASKTDSYNGVISGTLTNGENGSAWISQLVNVKDTIGIRVSHGYSILSQGCTAHISVSGASIGNFNVVNISSGSAELLNQDYKWSSGSATGSAVIEFWGGRVNSDADPDAMVWQFDEVKMIRAGSSNSIPDTVISSGLHAQSGLTFDSAFFIVNGSYPVGTAGSYFISSDGGTTWDTAQSGTGTSFTTNGSNFKFKAEIYSNGAYGQDPKIYSYGVGLIQA